MQNFSNLLNYELTDKHVQFLTLALLFFTTVAGFLSNWATAKANELKLLPLLVFYFRGEFNVDRSIYLKNTGYGSAYNIEISPYTLFLVDIQKIYTLFFSVPGTNLISPNDAEIPLKIVAKKDDGTIVDKDLLQFHLDPDQEHKRSPVKIDIVYKNAAGNTYYQRFETGEKGLLIKQAPIKMGVLTRLYLLKEKSIGGLLRFYYSSFVWKLRKPYNHSVGAPLPKFKYKWLDKVARIYYGGEVIKK